jgi:antitoxin component YwqK of YwqJK toxin-antitoxin module
MIKDKIKKLQTISVYSKGILLDKKILDDIKADKFIVHYDESKKTITLTPYKETEV